MSRPVIVLDLETTGLDSELHEVWEAAVIELLPAGRIEHVWRIEPVRQMDEEALKVNQYRYRTRLMRSDDRNPLGLHGLPYWSGARAVSSALVGLLDDVTIVGATPQFDQGFLTPMLARYGFRSTPWHHRARDIGSMAHGYLAAMIRAGRMPLASLPPVDSSTDVYAVALGLDPADYQRHSALGDCRLIADMYDTIAGPAGIWHPRAPSAVRS
jgi:DNA polymerase III epsilon subunit-like protein